MKELERVEGKIETREKERRKTVDTKLIDDIKQEITRLVDKKRDLRQQLSSQQAGPASALRCCPAAAMIGTFDVHQACHATDSWALRRVVC